MELMEKSLYKTYELAEEKHWWFRGRRSIIDMFFKKYGIVAGKSHILDFGCNTGFFVGRLQEKGYEVKGIDMSSDAVEFGTKMGVRNLVVGKTPVPFLSNSFDVFLALDVIEHIQDHDAAMRDLYRVLKPGGTAFVMVPAFMFMWGLQDKVAHHFRRYSKKELKQLVLRNGFKIERITYFNFFMFIPIAIVRILQRVVPPKRSSDFDINNMFINTILTKLFVFEARLMKYINFPFGVSLIIVLKK
jgi:2-polyprenyl-3-methyl-5-hydroxy-6-metoxy-1,4-benzoquinol methylase